MKLGFSGEDVYCLISHRKGKSRVLEPHLRIGPLGVPQLPVPCLSPRVYISLFWTKGPVCFLLPCAWSVRCCSEGMQGLNGELGPSGKAVPWLRVLQLSWFHATVPAGPSPRPSPWAPLALVSLLPGMPKLNVFHFFRVSKGQTLLPFSFSCWCAKVTCCTENPEMQSLRNCEIFAWECFLKDCSECCRPRYFRINVHWMPRPCPCQCCERTGRGWKFQTPLLRMS